MREPAVGEVVVRLPKTLPADISVAQARACFADDHVHMLLLTESCRTVPADLPAEDARQLLLARGQRRLAVVDDDGVLVGLLCLKRRLTGFCSDADVAARAAERGA